VVWSVGQCWSVCRSVRPVVRWSRRVLSFFIRQTANDDIYSFAHGTTITIKQSSDNGTK